MYYSHSVNKLSLILLSQPHISLQIINEMSSTMIVNTKTMAVSMYLLQQRLLLLSNIHCVS